MSLFFKSMAALRRIHAVADDTNIVVRNDSEYNNVEVSDLKTYFTTEVNARIDNLDYSIKASIEDALSNEYAQIPNSISLAESNNEIAEVPYAVVLTINSSNNRAGQLVMGSRSDELYWRGYRDIDGGWGEMRRVLHDGNFDPDTKLDKTETAVAAERLETPRRINGVLFDGSEDIIVPHDKTDGTGDKSYLYTQHTPETVWIVEHDLFKYPSVTIVDSAGSVVTGAVTAIDLNTTKIEFSFAFAGQAFFN